MVLRIMQKIDEISNDADKCKMRQVILACFDFIICVCSFIFTLSLLDMSSSSYYLLPVFIYAIINEISILKFRCYDSLWKCGG